MGRGGLWQIRYNNYYCYMPVTYIFQCILQICVIDCFCQHFVGHGDSNSRNIPTLVKDISNVGEVSCGSSHTIALSKDGRTVWSFGGGDNGELSLTHGEGATEQTYVFTGLMSCI